ncbi:hypothetical protein Tco_0644329 [Tanacetum coccineum]
MDDPNITIEEYIRLEEEKAHRRGKVYNWETATYGKIWDNKDVHDLGSVETKFLAIVFNDTLTSEALLCELTVSSLNNDEIDFRISFDESDDEDCTVIFDKKSFSYKIISINDLKTDSENDNDKVNIPLLPSPEPTVSCFDDLDFFKDFENEFPAIVYNNAQTSKSDLLTEPILNGQHIDYFNLKDETSLSECDEEEQNVLNFNDIFPFNVIYPNDSKSDKDNDDDKVDIEQSSRDLSIKPLPDVTNTDVGAYAHGFDNEEGESPAPNSGRATRRYIPREREVAEEKLKREYFRRRYRMSFTLFKQIVNDITNYNVHPLPDYFLFFKQRSDYTGRLGFSPIMKCTSIIRQLAYNSSPDAFDEYLQVAERLLS